LMTQIDMKTESRWVEALVLTSCLPRWC